MAVGQTSYLNVVTLLPLYVKANHNVFSYLEIGILLSVYQIGFLCAAPFVGDNLSRVGRRRMILSGVTLMSAAITLFSIAAYFKNDYQFFAISLTARLMQGMADAMVEISIFSIAMIEWSDQAEFY